MANEERLQSKKNVKEELMGYVAVSYVFGIALAVIGYYIFRKYPGKVGRALSVVFGLIGVLVFIYTVVITIVMIKDHRSY